eukprot:43151-Alexandrium_andersonii.AAC.1
MCLAPLAASIGRSSTGGRRWARSASSCVLGPSSSRLKRLGPTPSPPARTPPTTSPRPAAG